jgi:hypothetical protein
MLIYVKSTNRYNDLPESFCTLSRMAHDRLFVSTILLLNISVRRHEVFVRRHLARLGIIVGKLYLRGDLQIYPPLFAILENPNWKNIRFLHCASSSTVPVVRKERTRLNKRSPLRELLFVGYDHNQTIRQFTWRNFPMTPIWHPPIGQKAHKYEQKDAQHPLKTTTTHCHY